MSATNVPCAEWGSSRYVRTESAFHIQTCLASQPNSRPLTWHTVEVVPIQREPVPVKDESAWPMVAAVVAILLFLAWLVSR